MNQRNYIKLWQKTQCALCKKLWIEESHKLAPIVGLKKRKKWGVNQRVYINTVSYLSIFNSFWNPILISYQETEIKTNFWQAILKFQNHFSTMIKDIQAVVARTYLQLPLWQWGAGNVYLLVLSSWKVNIAENPIVVMGL